MRINNINQCIGNNLGIKKDSRKLPGNASSPSTSDVFFRSANLKLPKETTRNLQQEARLLFMNPKYETSFKTFRRIFENITRYLSEEARQKVANNRGWGLYNDTPIIIKNEPQLKFLEHVLAYNMEPDNPMIEQAHFNYDLYLASTLNRIDTEENADAKSRAFDFFMKHPENIFDFACSNTVNSLLLYSEKDRNKNYIEFIDNNYDTITQTLNISNEKLMEHLYHVNSDMNWDFNAHKGEWFMDVWNIMMGKEDITEFAKRHRLDKKQAQKRNGYYLKDWYLNNITEHNKNARKTAENLRQVFNHDKIQFSLNARNLSEILEFDENITIPELLYIDNVVNSFTPHRNIRDAYEMASPFVKPYVREKVDYNENNRKFLWYVADDRNRLFYERQQRFLNKTLLESIKTPEQLATAMKVYDEYCDKGTLPAFYSTELAILIKNNLCFEDIMKINRESNGDDEKLCDYLYLVNSGKFQKRPVEKQLEIF